MIAVAIDTGGTKITGAAVNTSGEILAEVRRENTGQSGDFFLETYGDIIRAYSEQYPVAAVGVGCNGTVDTGRGVVLECSLPYTGFVGRPLGQELERACGLPVYLGNDCRMAMVGEHWRGAARGLDNALGIFLGTGLGGCYLHGGRVVEGSRLIAGEIGHSVLYPGGRPCGCGGAGCAERYLSGTALWQGYNRLAGGEVIRSGHQFFRRYTAGEPLAAAVLERFVEDFCVFLKTCTNCFDPQAVIVGGGLADTREHWWDSLVARYLATSASCMGAPPLLPAEKGNRAPLLGAARMAFRRAGIAAEA